MDELELKVPPLVLAGSIALLMWPLSSLLPAVAAPVPLRWGLFAAIGLVGIGFSIAASRAFRRAGTTLDPRHPERAASFIRTGVFSVSRNPMYVGMMLGLLSWAVWLASPLSLAGPVVFIAYLNRFQIEPEERVLAAKFGDEFEAYRASVRRWL